MQDETKKKKQFIHLKGEGVSYDKIAKKIKVSKPTLIKWNSEYSFYINKLKEINCDELLNQYKMTKEMRIQYLCKELQKAWGQFDKATYDEMNKKEIILVIEKLHKILKEEISISKKIDKKNKRGYDKLRVRLPRFKKEKCDKCEKQFEIVDEEHSKEIIHRLIDGDWVKDESINNEIEDEFNYLEN